MNGNYSRTTNTNIAVTDANNTIFIEIKNTPIKYTPLENYSVITNILLVDNAVTNHNDFFANSNSNTFPIIYDSSSKSDELASFIKNNFKSVICIGLVFDYDYDYDYD